MSALLSSLVASDPADGEFSSQLLRAMLSMRASDLHLRAGRPAFARVDGRMCCLGGEPLSLRQVVGVIRHTHGGPWDQTAAQWEYSYEMPGMARFRVHAFREAGGLAASFRSIPLRVPTFAELRLPPVVKTLSVPAPGLVLVTGPTGSGKSSTAASMLHHMAQQESVHLLSIEDPVEYRLVDVPSCVTQREVGRDVASYADGLKAALREDPDILFVGEIRDVESLTVALHAAETGHAVYSTFHTGTALRTVQRLISMFPAEEQNSVRGRLADMLRGCISQRLLQRKAARSRVLCTEVLINNYAMKECIRDGARTAGIPAILERSNDQLMHTFDQALASMVRDGLITADVALMQATTPNDLKRALQLSGVLA